MSITIDNIVYTLVSGNVYVTGFTGFPTNVNILSNVTINSVNYNVTKINNSAFNNCISLKSITIPYEITSIEKYAFYNCTSLNSVTMTNNVINIGVSAFSLCVSLTFIAISTNITIINNDTFSNCSSLTSFVIPNNVTVIGDNAFASCSQLPSLIIPNGVTTIGFGAFSNCSRLTSITIPNNVKIISDNMFENCTSLSSVIIPENLISIGNIAFRGCTSLETISIPSTITSIGIATFQACTSLTSVLIPDSVTYIDDYAFYNCTNLTSITIPSSVTKIGRVSFGLCPNLASVIVINSRLITTVRSDSFTNVSSNSSSIIRFLNTTSIDDLSSTWQTISNYYAHKILYVGKIPTMIYGVPSTDEKTNGDTPFYLSYISDNKSSPTYSSTYPSVASINQIGLVTISSQGETSLTISIPETDIYTAGLATCHLTIVHDYYLNPFSILTSYDFEYFLTNTNAVCGEITVSTLQVRNLLNKGNESKEIVSNQKCALYK